MGEIIDLLTPKVDEGASFTVDTTVPAVDLDVTSPGLQVLYAGSGNSHRFARGDCFIVLSCGYFIPNGFAFHSYEEAGSQKLAFPAMLLQGLRSITGPPGISIFSFGNLGTMKIPFPNYEIAAGTFTDTEDNNLDEDFDLTIIFPYTVGVDKPQISMTNVPATLHGTTFRVIPFVKVLHNIALS